MNEKMYIIKDAALILGVSHQTVSKRAVKRNVELKKVHKFKMIKESDLHLLHDPEDAIKIYWKVSVFNDDLSCFVVKQCGLSKFEADKVVADFQERGFLARATPHIPITITQIN